MTDAARATIEIIGEASAEGVLVVAGEIGSRAQLLRAIDALWRAASDLWPQERRRCVVERPNDFGGQGGRQ